MRGVISIWLLLPLFALGQNVDQRIFPVQGGYIQSDDMSLSWTLGEGFIETSYLPEMVLTQGFQQSFYARRIIGPTAVEDLVSQIMPNPTEGLLTIYMNNDERPYTLEILDLTGRLMHMSTASTPRTELDLSSFASGQYFVRVRDNESNKFTLIEIVKL